jgi:hypothetical protein
MLAPADKAKYDEATATASQRAAAVAQQEAEAAAAKHRLEQFQAALSELMLFKSRTDVILLQVGGRVQGPAKQVVLPLV